MNKKIDLSNIKENDVDKTLTFLDVKERKIKKEDTSIDDIEEMVNEEKKESNDLTKELKKIDKEKNLEKTKTFEMPEQPIKIKKKASILNILGGINLICIVYYAYLLVLSNSTHRRLYYLILGCSIILSIFLFGLASISHKEKIRKVFNILNIISTILFISFSIYLLIK